MGCIGGIVVLVVCAALGIEVGGIAFGFFSQFLSDLAAQIIAVIVGLIVFIGILVMTVSFIETPG